MGVQSDLGPTGPTRWQIYQRARELETLSHLAVELSASGPNQNLPRALATMEQMRAILGESESD